MQIAHALLIAIATWWKNASAFSQSYLIEGDITNYSKALTRIMDFLSLFCIDDGKEARPLQPQTALARLREDVNALLPGHSSSYIERFRTHSYNAHCLLDMVAEDCCNAHTGFLELFTIPLWKPSISPPELEGKFPHILLCNG